MKILIAVDGSKASLHAVDCVVEHANWYGRKPEIELVTVHLPVPKLPRMGLAVGRQQIDTYYAEEGEASLAPARRKLERAGLKLRQHILVGDIAGSIVKHARATNCDLICVGSRGMSAVAKAFVGSTATKVLQLADRPVLLVK